MFILFLPNSRIFLNMFSSTYRERRIGGIFRLLYHQTEAQQRPSLLSFLPASPSLGWRLHAGGKRHASQPCHSSSNTSSAVCPKPHPKSLPSGTPGIKAKSELRYAFQTATSSQVNGPAPCTCRRQHLIKALEEPAASILQSHGHCLKELQ